MHSSISFAASFRRFKRSPFSLLAAWAIKHINYGKHHLDDQKRADWNANWSIATTEAEVKTQVATYKLYNNVVVVAQALAQNAREFGLLDSASPRGLEIIRQLAPSAAEAVSSTPMSESIPRLWRMLSASACSINRRDTSRHSSFHATTTRSWPTSTAVPTRPRAVGIRDCS